MATYPYSYSTYFPNGIDVTLLETQIRNDTTITAFLTSIIVDVPNDVVDINFDVALTPIEETALNNIVSSYQPVGVGTNLVLNSTASDSSAIQILATSPYGGIVIQSGLGGINIDTTNGFMVDAGAQSNLTVTNGNLILESTNALINVDGAAGINIGNNTNSGPVNIATSLARNVNIGTTAGSNMVAVQTGSGGFTVNTGFSGPVSINANGASSNLTLATDADNQDLTVALTGSTNSRLVLSSAGNGTDAIFLNSAGGVTLRSNTQPVEIVADVAAGNAITLDTNASGGGIILSSGVFGIGINGNGGAIGIGHWSGGTIYLGTAASRNLFIGNNNAGTNLYLRQGNALITSQPAEFAIPDSDTTLTAANLLSKILYGNPSADRILTLPSYSDIAAAISDLVVGDSFDLSVINQSTINKYTLTTTTIIGNADVLPTTTGLFRVRLTGLPDAFTLFRIA